MSLLKKIRWAFVGILGRVIVWLWAKSTKITVVGEEDYLELKKQKKPVILLIWHGRIFIVPYFFRNRGIMPLISPSEDGEIVAQIMAGWGYKIVRGSGSHAVVKAWNQMKVELIKGGELLIVPDGPKGPNRKLKPGCIKLAQETGAYLVPFTFSTSRKKFLRSWDRFLLFYPFSRVVAIYGKPFTVDADLKAGEYAEESQRIENIMSRLEEEADRYFG